jgi:catechol 2,3-dioxygenase-like lactoylglutathione lyase family enzyme
MSAAGRSLKRLTLEPSRKEPHTSPVPARLGIVTLGVADLARSVEFYEALGWERASSSMDEICWFHTADTNLGLFPRRDLADDVGVPDEPPQRYAGFTLAINVETEDEVGAALQAAVDAGATLVKPVTHVDWGGLSAYFADPDGFLWEIAWNPSFPIDAEGRLHIP